MAEAKLNRYKLVGGPHIAQDVTDEPMKDESGKPVLNLDGSQKYPVRKFEGGAIVVSAEDLTKKFINKFVYAGPYGGLSVQRSVAPPPKPVAPEAPVNPLALETPPRFAKFELEAMTVADLRSLASEEGIDLGHAHLKAEIVAALMAAK